MKPTVQLKSSNLLKQVMGDYFRSLADAPKIAWCTSVGPAELLRAFGFEVYFPENHGALIGATRKASDYIPASFNLGYSSHVCSYTTSDIGAYIRKETPLKKHYGLSSIPKPDLIVYNTNQCREVQDWFGFFAREFNCPIAGIKPPRHLDQVSKEDIKYVAEQFKAIIPVCEKASGQKFDLEKFNHTLLLSAEATLLWQEVLATAKNNPSPFSFFDGTIHMGPIVVLRGTQTAKDYYNSLLHELNQYVEKGIGLLNGWHSRIFWDGMPIWGKLRYLSDLFLDNQSIVLASTYCNSWIFEDFDPKNPFESCALAYTKIFINRSENAKMDMLKEWISDFKIDGMIFHDAQTCFNNSNARFGMPLRVKNETGIPSLVIEGDLNDLRFFSEGQSTTKIETFLEQIAGREIVLK